MSNPLDILQEALFRARSIPSAVQLHPVTRDRLIVDGLKARACPLFGTMTIFGLQIIPDPKMPRDRATIFNGDGQVIEVVNIGDDKEVEEPA